MRYQHGFPERLREARKRCGLSHRTLGDCIGKARSTVCNYERGVGYPTVETILLMAEVLHISVDDLLGYRQVKCRAKKKQVKHRTAKALAQPGAIE